MTRVAEPVEPEPGYFCKNRNRKTKSRLRFRAEPEPRFRLESEFRILDPGYDCNLTSVFRLKQDSRFALITFVYMMQLWSGLHCLLLPYPFYSF